MKTKEEQKHTYTYYCLSLNSLVFSASDTEEVSSGTTDDAAEDATGDRRLKFIATILTINPFPALIKNEYLHKVPSCLAMIPVTVL